MGFRLRLRVMSVRVNARAKVRVGGVFSFTNTLFVDVIVTFVPITLKRFNVMLLVDPFLRSFARKWNL